MPEIDFDSAVRSQPAQLALIRETVMAQLASAPLAALGESETLGVVGMGASHNSGHAVVAVLAAAGRRAVNLTATDVLGWRGGYQAADRYLLVSESGRSPEPIEAADRLTRGARVGVSNVGDSPLSQAVDSMITLGGVHDSAIYTVGYTGTLLTYALTLENMGVLPHDEILAAVPERVGSALTSFAGSASIAGDWIAAATSVDVIGRGVSLSAAAEFALMLREGVRMPTGCYETFEYTHGPIEAASPRTVVVMFGDERELELVAPLKARGVPVVLITASSSVDAHSSDASLTIVKLDPDLAGLPRAIVETVFAQLALVSASERLGIRLGEFSYDDLGTKIAD
ncbi:SIS domain-containing protein [Parafrigoribacterium soli]|uniref:SIS domain-containing protein n=1 Tax=Parafrigoribacterium soli TaxID=3144663 RepID=UPI0032F0527C